MYTHDFQQQLTKIVNGSNTYTYSYDGLGRRVTNVTNAGPTSYFLYAGDRMLYSKVGTTESAYVYVGSHLLLKKDGTGATPEARYYHQDIAPGNVRFVSYYTTSVQTDAKLRYKPSGDQILLAGAGGRFEYAHQELDAAVRLYHMGARYYDPVVGRFVERDPIGPGYDYADGNPISFYDPTGRDAWSDLGGWFAGIGHAAVDWAEGWAAGVQNAGRTIVGASTAAVSSVASAGQAVSNWWNGL